MIQKRRKQKMTIIVTGGAGFIGSNFVFHMLNKYPDKRCDSPGICLTLYFTC